MKKAIIIVVVLLGLVWAGYAAWNFVSNIGGMLKARTDEVATVANGVATSVAKWDLTPAADLMVADLRQSFLADKVKWDKFKIVLGEAGKPQPCTVPSISISSSTGTEAKARCPIDFTNGKAELRLTIIDPGGRWAIKEFELRL